MGSFIVCDLFVVITSVTQLIILQVFKEFFVKVFFALGNSEHKENWSREQGDNDRQFKALNVMTRSLNLM